MAMLLNVAEGELRLHLLAAENNGFVVMGNDSLPLNTLAFLFALYFFVCICICLCVFVFLFALIVALQDFCFLAGSRAQPLCIELKMLLMPDLYPLPALPSTCLLFS